MLVILLFGSFAVSNPAFAMSESDVDLTLADVEKRAFRSIEAGRPREAIDLLRGNADTVERALLLARAYLDDGNDFWAMRTLQGIAQGAEDCGPELWLVFALIRQGAMDDGRALLAEAECKEGSPLEVRRYLLETLIATTVGETDEARQALMAAASKTRAFPEDRRALLALRPSVEESYVTPISGRLELHSGWTSNARAGSPLDPAATGGPPTSPLAHVTASTRMVIPTDGALKPALEAELRGLGVGAEQARGLSYLQLSARPALLFGDRGSVLAGYRIDTLGILGGDQFDDGPLWFYQAHRGEVDVELTPWLTAFGGAGYRGFREARRSRLEVDAGAGGGWRLAPSLSLMGAVMGRFHKANRDFYDLYGATAIAQAQWRLAGGHSARIGAMASFDDYPRSDGYFAAGVSRRDLLARLTAGFWLSPTKNGLRAGLTYELSNRFSTAPDYEYVDHRVLVRGQWAYSFDPRGPRAELPAGHVPLAWGLDEADGALEESIQDLLRQDEAVRAGSSCVE